MTILTCPSVEAAAIAKALGLPKNTTGFILRVMVGEIPTIEVHTCVQSEVTQELCSVVQKFKLCAEEENDSGSRT